MGHYRCYFLDARDRIWAAENIEAHALAQAKEQGFAMLREHPRSRSIEIWQGSGRLYPAAAAGRLVGQTGDEPEALVEGY